MARLFKDFYTPKVLPIKQKFYSGLGEKEHKIKISHGCIKRVLKADGYVKQATQMFSYSHLATEKAIPHGGFDCKLNKGYITIGDSHESAAFLIDNLRWWWNKFGKNQYPDANHILLLCDCGGANDYRHQLFKVLLQGFHRNRNKDCCSSLSSLLLQI